MQFLGFNQTKGSSYNLPAHGSGGARARKTKSTAQKSAFPSEDGSAGGFKGGMPSRPSRSEAPPPARQEQSPAKRFSFPFRRKNRWRAQNQNRNENLFAGHASEASGGGAERQHLRSKWVRAFSNKGQNYAILK